jgi:hypothetical protein
MDASWKSRTKPVESASLQALGASKESVGQYK